jgi:hypothetical protein
MVQRRLIDQDIRKGVMGAAMRREAGTNEVVLADVMKLRMICTIIPGSPNNQNQYHVERITADDAASLFKDAGGNVNSSFRIQGGKGPAMDVFIPPSEATVRFAWQNDALAKQTIRIMLDLDFDGSGGLPRGTRNLTGFLWMNEQREIHPHARSVALEMLVPFGDNLMGRVATRLPKETPQLKGNMTSASMRIAAAPSAKVDMPDSSRKLILGIISGVLADE